MNSSRERKAPQVDAETSLVRPGQVLELRITDLAHDGAGVAHLPGSGYVVFVPGALPGEIVEAKVAEVRPRSGRANLRRLVEPSSDRVPSACSAAAKCGGCSLGHLSYQAQLAFKTRRVEEALRRIGRLAEVTVSPCLASPQTTGYRNKMQFVVFQEAGEPFHLRLGQFAPGTRRPVPAEDCHLAAPTLRKVAQVLSDALTRLGQDHVRPHHVILRLSAATGEVMVILVTAEAAFPGWERFTTDLMARVPEVKSVVQLVNPRTSGTVLTGRRVRTAGRGYIVDRLGQLTFHLSPESFLQVNPAQTVPLYDLVRTAADLHGTEELLDVYCGIGSIALYLAPGARRVTGVEVIPAAVRDASAMAQLNGVHHAKFLAGAAERLLPGLAARGYRPDVVVLDPPRAGVARESLDAVVALQPARLVYVSCDPETLARDLRLLTDSGYRVRQVQPVDMFPQTSHTEAVAVVTRE